MTTGEWVGVLALVTAAAVPGLGALIRHWGLAIQNKERIGTLEKAMETLLKEVKGAASEMRSLLRDTEEKRNGRCNLHDELIRELLSRLSSIETKVDLIHERGTE